MYMNVHISKTANLPSCFDTWLHKLLLMFFLMFHCFNKELYVVYSIFFWIPKKPKSFKSHIVFLPKENWAQFKMSYLINNRHAYRHTSLADYFFFLHILRYSPIKFHISDYHHQIAADTTNNCIKLIKLKVSGKITE